MRTIQLCALAMAFVALLTGHAYGQVRKCTGPDGKVTYSDSICATGTAKESGVTVNANTIDSSGLRQQAQKNSDEGAMGRAASAGQCKFTSYVYGDAKGKLLAADAKQECLENIVAKTKGEAISLEAYNLWKDHFAQKSANRQAAISRAQSAADAQSIANSNRNAIDAVGNNPPGMTADEIAALAPLRDAAPSILFRYPVDRAGEDWRGLYGFEPNSFIPVLQRMKDDFERLRSIAV